jgi:polar amino acid transport system ATP-binding protein
MSVNREISGEIVLKVDNLCKSFGKHEILSNVSFTVKKGEVIAIIGPSGCGKSTLIRTLNLLEAPTGGHIWFHDKDLTQASRKEISKIIPKIGMVFQQFNLFNNLTVRRNITMAPVLHGIMSKEEADDWATGMLDRIGLREQADKYPSQLSGGQKQRVAIVRTMAMNPEIILFDEPTSALDPEMVYEVLSLVRELADSGMTMMLVTHEMKFARNASSRVFFVHDRNIQEDGTPEQVFDNPRNQRLREFLMRVSCK